MRAVFDTNVVVSAALLARSTPRQAFDKALDEGTLLISLPVLLELIEVLSRPKLDRYVTEHERMLFLLLLLKEAELVEVTEHVTECRDSKDNKILELAVSGAADFVVSGDGDLLVLHPFRGITILRPREFLRIPSA